MSSIVGIIGQIAFVSAVFLAFLALVLRKRGFTITGPGWALYGVSTFALFAGLSAEFLFANTWLARLTTLQGWLLFGAFIACLGVVDFWLTRKGVLLARPRAHGAQQGVPADGPASRARG